MPLSSLYYLDVCGFIALGPCILFNLSASDKVKKYSNFDTRLPDELMFCVLSEEELAKCEAFATAAARDHLRNEATFGSYYRPILCKQVPML